MNYDSVIMFSGGLDSTTILLERIREGDNPLCILFDYDQKHKVELVYAKQICDKLGVGYRIVKLPALSRDDASGGMIVGNRNIIFLSFAHYIAKDLGVHDLYCGFCEGDDSGFPDCRKEFVSKVQESLDLGYGVGINIHTPLLDYSKSETYFKNYRNGDLPFILENTLTCYMGNTTKHEWGLGCGECMSCKGRIKGFTDFKEFYLD